MGMATNKPLSSSVVMYFGRFIVEFRGCQCGKVRAFSHSRNRMPCQARPVALVPLGLFCGHLLGHLAKLNKGHCPLCVRSAPMRAQPHPRQVQHPFAAGLIPAVSARRFAPCFDPDGLGCVALRLPALVLRRGPWPELETRARLRVFCVRVCQWLKSNASLSPFAWVSL